MPVALPFPIAQAHQYELSSYEVCVLRPAVQGDGRAQACSSGAPPRLRVGFIMSNDNKSLNTTAPSKISNRRTGESQDAVRHEKDAQHHKFPKGPQSSGADQKSDQQSRARAQQDGVDMQQIEGGQPEIPKVGSRDAPGG